MNRVKECFSDSIVLESTELTHPLVEGITKELELDPKDINYIPNVKEMIEEPGE